MHSCIAASENVVPESGLWVSLRRDCKEEM